MGRQRSTTATKSGCSTASSHPQEARIRRARYFSHSLTYLQSLSLSLSLSHTLYTLSNLTHTLFSLSLHSLNLAFSHSFYLSLSFSLLSISGRPHVGTLPRSRAHAAPVDVEGTQLRLYRRRHDAVAPTVGGCESWDERGDAAAQHVELSEPHQEDAEASHRFSEPETRWLRFLRVRRTRNFLRVLLPKGCR